MEVVPGRTAELYEHFSQDGHAESELVFPVS
jgi:hypothetical protein